LVRVSLERAGLQVLLTSDPLAALELARSICPDLILLDFTLPGLNGGELYERLQQDSLTRKIPVLVLGSRAADADVFRAQDEYLLRLGVRVLYKPFHPVHLLAQVRDLLDDPA
jgi:CheY-like chemotaxis protein